MFSYIDAGEILSRGGNNIPARPVLGFGHYLMAYRGGALFMENRMKELEAELRAQGVKLPHITYID